MSIKEIARKGYEMMAIETGDDREWDELDPEDQAVWVSVSYRIVQAYKDQQYCGAV